MQGLDKIITPVKRAFLLLILLLHELHLVSDLELLNTSHVQYSEGYVFIQIAKKSLIQFVFQNTPQRFNSIEISRLKKHTFTLVFIKLVSGRRERGHFHFGNLVDYQKPQFARLGKDNRPEYRHNPLL